MEVLVSFFTFLILLVCLFLLGAAIYKSRSDIANWLNEKQASANRSTRKVLLQRLVLNLGFWWWSAMSGKIVIWVQSAYCWYLLLVFFSSFPLFSLTRMILPRGGLR